MTKSSTHPSAHWCNKPNTSCYFTNRPFTFSSDQLLITASNLFYLFHSSSNSISAPENSGTGIGGSGDCAKGLTRSNSGGVVVAQDGTRNWSANLASELLQDQKANGNKSEPDGRSQSSVSSSVNLMRNPSYQSTASAMKNDIK